MMKKVIQICVVLFLESNTAFAQTWETFVNDSLVSRVVYKKDKLVDSTTGAQFFHFSYYNNGRLKEKTFHDQKLGGQTVWRYHEVGTLISKVKRYNKTIVYNKHVQIRDNHDFIVSINSWNCYVGDSLPRLYWRSEGENSWPLEAYQNTFSNQVLSQKVHYGFSKGNKDDSLIALFSAYFGGEFYLSLDSLNRLAIPVLPKKFLKQTLASYDWNLTRYLEENAAKILVTRSPEQYLMSTLSALKIDSKPLHELQSDYKLGCQRFRNLDSVYCYVFRLGGNASTYLVIAPSLLHTIFVSKESGLPQEYRSTDVSDETVDRLSYELVGEGIVLIHELRKNVCKNMWWEVRKSYAFLDTIKNSYINEHILPEWDQIPYFLNYRAISVNSYIGNWDIQKLYSVMANYPFCDSSLASFTATNKSSDDLVFYSKSGFGTITQKNGNISRVVYFKDRYQFPYQLLNVVSGKQNKGSLDTFAIVTTKVEKRDNHTIREIYGTLLPREFQRFESLDAKLLIEKIKYQKVYSTFKIVETVDCDGRLISAMKYIDNVLIEQKTVVKK